MVRLTGRPVYMKEQERSKRWQQKVEREFLAAYDEQADTLFRHVMLRARDRETAKDIVQETFSRTWLYLSQGKEIAYLRAFLFRVANNLIVDRSRRKRSASLDKMMEDDGFEPVDEAAADPLTIPQTREALDHLRSLDEIYQTAIRMRFFDNKSPKEIAAELGVTENVVSVRIHRGIERLSRLMARHKPALGR